MPVMDGQEEIEALLRLNPAARIIVVSGLGTIEKTDALCGLPMKHFLTKPFTIEDLLRTVRSVLAEPSTS